MIPMTASYPDAVFKYLTHRHHFTLRFVLYSFSRLKSQFTLLNQSEMALINLE